MNERFADVWIFVSESIVRPAAGRPPLLCRRQERRPNIRQPRVAGRLFNIPYNIQKLITIAFGIFF